MADKPIVAETFNESLDVEKMVREGGVHAKIHLEVQGNDEEASKKALESVVNERMAKEKNLFLVHSKMYDIVKEEDAEVFSGVVEVELVSRDFRWFINMIMRYGPTAIEIIGPEEFRLNTDEAHSLVADISEMTQVYSHQIMSLLKDEERVALYNKLLSGED